MKVINRLFLTLMLLLGVLEVSARVYSVDDVPNVRLVNKYDYVSDPENVLSRVAVDSINSMLRRLEETTAIEVAVVVVPAVPDGDCFDFAYRLGEKWGVGKKERDNGLVILLATDDRCVQFVTGYGLEGDLPDALCKRIQSKYMLSYFSDGRWSEGLVAGVRATCGQLDGTQEAMKGEDEGGNYVPMLMLMLFGIVLVSIVAAEISARKARRCPKCGKHKLVRSDSVKVMSKNGVWVNKVTYVCSACGHVVVRNENRYDNNSHRGGGSGPIFFGGFGGGHGGFGGGFSGGSFGGGSFGGGGAGSRF